MTLFSSVQITSGLRAVPADSSRGVVTLSMPRLSSDSTNDRLRALDRREAELLVDVLHEALA